MMDAMLRDRLVHGVTEKQVQNRYLMESKLSYTVARDVDKDSQRLREGTDASGQITPCE